jgi:DNA (cytosine-5)-methyltransferase 1
MGIEQAYAKIRQIQQDNGNDGFQWNTESHRSRPEPHCIGFAEIDRFASSIYKYHWPDVRNFGDATKIICDELPDFDFLVGGFPCQAFSIAGKRKGFQDTRGTLFFEIARILESKRPRHFLLENVAGLLSHDNGQTFRTIIATLDEIGYDTEWTVINSKHHGVPQNRERVFIIGHSRNGCGGEVLSFGNDDGEFNEIQRETGSERQWLSVDTESPQRDKPRVESGRDGRERYGDSVTVGTLPAHRIRRLTEIECERLQGLPDDFSRYGINHKGEVCEISASQRYKTLGNAMTVNVIEAIVTRMIQVGCLDGNEEAHRTNVLPVV